MAEMYKNPAMVSACEASSVVQASDPRMEFDLSSSSMSSACQDPGVGAACQMIGVACVLDHVRRFRAHAPGRLRPCREPISYDQSDADRTYFTYAFNTSLRCKIGRLARGASNQGEVPDKSLSQGVLGSIWTLVEDGWALDAEVCKRPCQRWHRRKSSKGDKG